MVRTLNPYLTQCINEMVLESQLPHSTVNFSVLVSDSRQYVDDFVEELSTGARFESSHQQPEVNYSPRFSPQLIFLERYTLSVYRAGEIDLFENLDIVHITLLVVSPYLLSLLITLEPRVD